MLIGSLLPILVGLPSGWFWSTFNRPLRVPLHKWLIQNDTCFNEPRAFNVFMAKVHTRYCGLLVRGSHVEK